MCYMALCVSRDTAGQERFCSLSSTFCRGAEVSHGATHSCLFCCTPASPHSLTPHTPHSLPTLLHFPSSHVTSHSTPTLPCTLHTSLASMIQCLQVSHNNVSCYLNTPHPTLHSTHLSGTLVHPLFTSTPHSPHLSTHLSGTLVHPLFTSTPHSPHLTPHTLVGPLYTHSSLPHLSLSHCRAFSWCMTSPISSPLKAYLDGKLWSIR